MRVAVLISLVLLLTTTAPTTAQSPCDNLSQYPVRFAILGDRTGEHQEGVFGQCVIEAARLRPEFVMTVGDMIEGYTSDTAVMREQWDEYFTLIEPITVPIYHTPGNHDITTDAMEPAFRENIGEPYYSFDQRGIHFIIMDNAREESWEEIPDAQLEWLVRDLEKHLEACYTIVFFHKPLWYRTLGDNKPDPLHEIFKSYGVDAVFSGHFHNYFAGTYDGILYTTIGSSGGGTVERPIGLLYHWAWVTVDSDGIHVAPIMMDAVLARDAQTVAELRHSYEVENNSVSFDNPVIVGSDLELLGDSVKVTLRNSTSLDTYEDTIRWNVPDGWSVSPEVVPYKLEGDSPVSLSFAISADESLFPVPSLETVLPYASDKTLRTSHQIEITRLASAQRVEQPVAIDGQLSETCWQTPVTTLFDYDNNTTGRDSTAVFFAYDDNNLYMAVYGYESVMDSLVATMTERDSDVYTEDAFGLLFEPDSELGFAYQVYINPVGTVYDQKITRGSDGHWAGDPVWNGDYEIKTTIGDDAYVIEARIPLEQIGATIDSGDSWRVNFRRKQLHASNAYAFQNPWSYDPHYFGLLEFK